MCFVLLCAQVNANIYIQLCGCVCVIWNSFGVGKSHSYLKKITDLEEIVVFFFFFLSLVRSSSRLGVFSIESMQNRHFHFESNVFDVRWNGFGCQHSFRSLFARSLHRFWMTCTPPFPITCDFSLLRQWVCERVFRFLSIYVSKGKPIDFSHCPRLYTHTHNIHFVSFSSDFINIETKFSTWIIHNHFD